MEVVAAEAEFGAFSDGDPLLVAIPPQGGAPFTPLRVRIAGFARPTDGLSLEAVGVDAETGEAFGTLVLGQRFICANVGASAGAWVAPDLHFRYPGWDLPDLYGRSAAFEVSVDDDEGVRVVTRLTGVLTEPEPG